MSALQAKWETEKLSREWNARRLAAEDRRRRLAQADKDADQARLRELQDAQTAAAAEQARLDREAAAAEADRRREHEMSMADRALAAQKAMMDRISGLFGGAPARMQSRRASGSNRPSGVGFTPTNRVQTSAPTGATQAMGDAQGSMKTLMDRMKTAMNAERSAIAGMTNTLDDRAAEDADVRRRRAERLRMGPQTLFSGFAGQNA